MKKKYKIELYRLLDEGRKAIKEGRKRPLADIMSEIKQEIADGKRIFYRIEE